MSETLFTIRNLKRAFDDKVVLDIPELHLPKGETVCIVGESGCGKTTLLELLGLMNFPDEQDIGYNDIDLALQIDKSKYQYKDDLWNYENKMAGVRKNYFSFLFQESNLFPNLNMEENVILPALIQGSGDHKQWEQELDQLFENIQLSHRRFYDVKHLSVGQRQRASFARGAFRDHEVLFADEPTGNLDPFNASKVFNLITRHVDQDKKNSAVIVTHSLDMALKHSDRIVALTKDGYCDNSQSYYQKNGEWHSIRGKIGSSDQAKKEITKIVDTEKQIENKIVDGKSRQKKWHTFEKFFGEKYKEDFALYDSVKGGLSGLNLKAILILLILFTGICAIGFANGSLADLSRRMSDPFVNWLDVELTDEYRYNAEKLIKPLKQPDIGEEYNISQISRFSQYALLIQDLHSDGSRFVRGRTIDHDDQILSKLSSPDFLIRGSVFSDEKDLGLVVSEDFFSTFGYDKNALFVNMTYSSENAEYSVPVPIQGVVKELPGDNKFLSTNYFKYERYHSKSYPQPFNPVGTDRLILFTPGSEQQAFTLLDSLERFLRNRESITEGKLLNFAGDPQPYNRTWKKGFVIPLSFSQPVDVDDLDKIFNNIIESGKFDGFNLTQMYNTNFDNRAKAPFVKDRLSLNLGSIDKVFELKRYLQSEFNIKLDVARVELLKNFNRVKKITITLSWTIIFFTIFSVSIFIFFYLYINLYKQRVHLGSLKAFGLTKDRLQKFYLSKMLKFIAKITLIAIIGAALAGYSGLIREIWSALTQSESDALYFQLIDFKNITNIKNLSLLSFIVFLFLGGYYSVKISSNKILDVSPGDLVKDRI
ncbi:MAG TPA: ATP-binding cassette domain-containing protein [bacterium]|nr:ATP-binding cassette domain-containing protein [bacterium]